MTILDQYGAQIAHCGVVVIGRAFMLATEPAPEIPGYSLGHLGATFLILAQPDGSEWLVEDLGALWKLCRLLTRAPKHLMISDEIPTFVRKAGRADA